MAPMLGHACLVLASRRQNEHCWTTSKKMRQRRSIHTRNWHWAHESIATLLLSFMRVARLANHDMCALVSYPLLVEATHAQAKCRTANGPQGDRALALAHNAMARDCPRALGNASHGCLALLASSVPPWKRACGLCTHGLHLLSESNPRQPPGDVRGWLCLVSGTPWVIWHSGDSPSMWRCAVRAHTLGAQPCFRPLAAWGALLQEDIRSMPSRSASRWGVRWKVRPLLWGSNEHIADCATSWLSARLWKCAMNLSAGSASGHCEKATELAL